RRGRHRHDCRPLGDSRRVRRADRSGLDRPGPVLPGRARRGGTVAPHFARRRLPRSRRGQHRQADYGDAAPCGHRDLARQSRCAHSGARSGRSLRNRQPHRARAPGVVGRRSRSLGGQDPPRGRDLHGAVHLRVDRRLLRRAQSRAAHVTHRTLLVPVGRVRLPEAFESHQGVARGRRYAGSHRRHPRLRRGTARARPLGRVPAAGQVMGAAPRNPQALVREDILPLKAYHVAPATGMVKLDAMENPYGLPDDLRAELGELAAATALNRYPDPTAPELRARLRKAFDIPADAGLLIGNGSDELITLVTQTLARPDAVMLAPEPSFAMYRMNAIYSRMRYVGVPLAEDFSLDLGRFLAAVEEHRPALTFIAYPNNPTGNLYPERDIEAIIEASPGFVVVDEAYHAFAGKSVMDRLARYPNLLVMRTVSKLGLAGIRLGYAAARPEWIDQFDKVRPPYNVNVLTQAVAVRMLDRLDVLNGQAARI